MRPSDAVAYKRMLIRLVKETIAQHFDADWNRIDPKDKEDFADVAADLSLYLPQCPTYFVTADMVAVAKAAGPSLPVENLGPDALPSPAGFMAFDAPIAAARFADQDLPVIAVAWEEFSTQAHSHGVTDQVDCTCPKGEEEGFDPDCPYVDPLKGIDLFPMVIYPIGPLKGQLMPIGRYDWAFGRTQGTGDPVGTVDDAPDLDSGKPLIATWVLMQQSITQSEPTRPDRHQRRMCAKQQIPAELVIVRLRRIEHPTSRDDDSPVPWSHRWLVGGHWRQQFYPSDRTNRPIWINPYVKGPESKPLVVKEKVTAWVR